MITALKKTTQVGVIESTGEALIMEEVPCELTPKWQEGYNPVKTGGKDVPDRGRGYY